MLMLAGMVRLVGTLFVVLFLFSPDHQNVVRAMRTSYSDIARTAMYNAETVLVGQNPVISINAACKDPTSKNPSIAWAVFPFEQKNGVGIDANTTCCTKKTLLPAGHFCSDGIVLADTVKGRVTTGSYVCNTTVMDVAFDKITHDGYWTVLTIGCTDMPIHSEFVFKSSTGYLPPDQYPLLVFHGVMSLVYLLIATVWLALTAYYWRDILKLQYWISAVILLSMLEMAMFYGWYEHSNLSGQGSKFLLGCSVFVMVAVLTISRMLVLIVCMGYGVVKPHLGEEMKKIIMFGIVYFLTAIIYWEAFYMQHAHALSLSVDENHRLQIIEFIFALPLSLLNAVCVIWIIMCLQTTKAQLKIRNQMVKYQMYNQFFYVLAVAALASVAAMVVQVVIARPSVRLDNWRSHWFDSAVWKIIFFVVLLSILFLWRPNANNKRFAYTKTSSNEDDTVSYSLMSPSYNDEMSLRLLRRDSPGAHQDETDHFVNNEDLDWVENNIPAREDEYALAYRRTSTVHYIVIMPSPIHLYIRSRMLFDDDETAEIRRLELNKME
eukprot:CFRG1203T1